MILALDCFLVEYEEIRVQLVLLEVAYENGCFSCACRTGSLV